MAEIQAKLAEVDRARAEFAEKAQKLQQESESIAQQLEEAELRYNLRMFLMFDDITVLFTERRLP